MTYLLLLLIGICFLIAPYFLSKFVKRWKVEHIFSEIVVCFIFGILLGNTRQWWTSDPDTIVATTQFAKLLTTITVLLAIPMLLMTSDVKAFLRYAPKLILSFFLCVVAALVAIFLTTWWWRDLPLVAQTAGILTGVYIGGTPNMVAIAYATKSPESLFLILTATDIFCGGIYFLFLTSIGVQLWSKLLPKFQHNKLATSENEANNKQEEIMLPIAINWGDVAKSIGLSLAIIGASAGVGLLFPDAKGNLNEMVVISVLTTVSIVASFWSKIRNLASVYTAAQYLLLIFAVSVGFMADFATFLEKGGAYTLYNGVFLLLLLFFHFFAAKVFRIDRDTFIVTSTACIFGPPFIGPVCKVIKNKELLGAGMALGVLGLILGNYLGILVYYVVEQFLA